MLPMQEILRIRHLSLVLMRELVEVLARAVEKLCNDWPTEREGVRSRGNLTNAFFLLVHNLNAGDYHFS